MKILFQPFRYSFFYFALLVFLTYGCVSIEPLSLGNRNLYVCEGKASTNYSYDSVPSCSKNIKIPATNVYGNPERVIIYISETSKRQSRHYLTFAGKDFKTDSFEKYNLYTITKRTFNEKMAEYHNNLQQICSKPNSLNDDQIQRCKDLKIAFSPRTKEYNFSIGLRDLWDDDEPPIISWFILKRYSDEVNYWIQK